MPIWFLRWTAVLFVMLALPLNAQEWIYCPAAPQALARQCQKQEETIQTHQERLTRVADQMRDTNIILARVHRQPDETVIQYKLRVRQQQGVATPETNHWLPVLGRYYDPDHQRMYVALDRQDYWQYIWETLAPNEDLARRTFKDREYISRQFIQRYFTGPGGKLAQWRQTIASAQRFREQCCQKGSALPAMPAPPQSR